MSTTLILPQPHQPLIQFNSIQFKVIEEKDREIRNREREIAVRDQELEVFNKNHQTMNESLHLLKVSAHYSPTTLRQKQSFHCPQSLILIR